MREREEELRMYDLALIFAPTYPYRIAIPEFLGHFCVAWSTTKRCLCAQIPKRFAASSQRISWTGVLHVCLHSGGLGGKTGL